MSRFLQERLDTRAIPLDELITDVQAGRYRIAQFQRGFVWDKDNMLDLLDSVRRSFPIGNLLLWERPGVEETLCFGTLEIHAKATLGAWYVVDGQQRLTTLAAVLLQHNRQSTKFQISYDLDKQEFVPVAKRPATPNSANLPMEILLNTEELLNWLAGLPNDGQRSQRLAEANKLARAFREYRVPAYFVRSQSDTAAREIFARLNRGGKPLKEKDVFNALLGATTPEMPRGLQPLENAVRDSGLGSIDAAWLVKATKAVAGLDPSIAFERQVPRDKLDERQREIQEPASKAIRLASEFLKNDVGIPHAGLIPYPITLVILARYFNQYPTITPRVRAVLRSWFLRGALGEVHQSYIAPEQRQALARITGTAEEAANRLWEETSHVEVRMPSFDDVRTNSARGKLLLSVLAGVGPTDLNDGEQIDVGAFFAELGDRVFVRLPVEDVEWKNRLASRFVQGEMTPRGLDHCSPSRLAWKLSQAGTDHGAWLTGHAVNELALAALRRKDHAAFLRERHNRLEELVEEAVLLPARVRPEAEDR